MSEWQYEPAKDHGQSPGQAFASARREVGLLGLASQACWQIVSKGYLRTYHRLSIVGREHLPRQAPFVLVANHTSHLDTLAIAAAVPWRLRPRVFPIAAGDTFFETQAARFFAAMLLNALPLWRRRCGPHALEGLRERLLGEPAIYVVFPEGTRARDGAMQAFKPGIGRLIASSVVPVVPCHVSGAFEALRPGLRFPRPVKIRVAIGAPLLFQDIADAREGWQRIAEQMETAVRALADQRNSR